MNPPDKPAWATAFENETEEERHNLVRAMIKGEGDPRPAAVLEVSRLPTLSELRAWTDEPFLALTDEQITAIFGELGDASAVDDLRQSHPWGSRRGLVLTFAAAHRFNAERAPHPAFAHLCAKVWTEGRAHSALAEFGLEESDEIFPEDLLRAMEAHRCSSVIMTPDELQAFAQLPDVMTVWRGGAGDGAAIKRGHSWTTSRTVAADFAKRAATGFGGEPRIAWRRIRKSQVIAYFMDRGESEIVIWPSRV